MRKLIGKGLYLILSAIVITASAYITFGMLDSKSKAESETEAPDFSKSVIEGKDGWYFTTNDGSEDYYKGTNILTETEMQEWKSSITALDDICKEKGVSLQILIAPNKEQVYSEYMPKCRIENDVKRQDVFCQYMEDNSDVGYSYPLAALKEEKGDMPLYFKQDSHWNQIGAYTGLMDVYKNLGLETVPVSEMSVSEVMCKGGDLAGLGNLSEDEYPDYIFDRNADGISIYLPRGEHTEQAAYDLEIYSNPDAKYADRKVAVIGDSFRSAVVCSVKYDFKETLNAHKDEVYRNTDAVTEYLNDLGDGDVLLIVLVERNDEKLPKLCECIASVLGGQV